LQPQRDATKGADSTRVIGSTERTAWWISAGTNFGDTTNSFTKNGNVFWTDPSPAPYSVKAVRPVLRAGIFPAATVPPVEPIKTDILLFQYCGDITALAQEFVFAPPVPTEVTLQSFSAAPLDSAVELAWETASELRNLGFHLYRASSDAGPWARITSSLIPGLGSSPIGQSYSFRDAGLTNGVRYFYRLEDLDASGVSTLHGPVSATPLAGAESPSTPADPSPGEPGRAAVGDAFGRSAIPPRSTCACCATRQSLRSSKDRWLLRHERSGYGRLRDDPDVRAGFDPEGRPAACARSRCGRGT
jgi:hypothetical protein